MAIQEVTSPPFLDDTAQTVVSKLDAIKNAINPNAQGVSYSHATSGLSAENVQEAVDELDGNIDTLSSSLTNKIVIESKELTFVSSVATLAKKDGYVLLQVYGIRPNNETGAGYHIDGWIASSDGNNYYIHNSVSNLNAGLSCRLIWVKS